MSAPTLAGIIAPAASSLEQKLTPQELDQAQLFLQQTQNSVVGATKGLSAVQWMFKPAPDRWSIAENLDHVVIVQERVLGPILESLAQAPLPPEGYDYEQVDWIVINQFSNRLAKFQAPEFVMPTEEFVPVEMLRRLVTNFARLAERLESPGLRRHAIESAPIKGVSKGAFDLMDGYQWILAAAAHAERHTKQMLEVKADDGFPAS